MQEGGVCVVGGLLSQYLWNLTLLGFVGVLLGYRYYGNAFPSRTPGGGFMAGSVWSMRLRYREYMGMERLSRVRGVLWWSLFFSGRSFERVVCILRFITGEVETCRDYDILDQGETEGLPEYQQTEQNEAQITQIMHKYEHKQK